MISLHDEPGGSSEQDQAPKREPAESKGQSPMSKADTSNQFSVGAYGGRALQICDAARLLHPISRAQAINLAAWLMVLADPTGEEFHRVLKEIVK